MNIRIIKNGKDVQEPNKHARKLRDEAISNLIRENQFMNIVYQELMERAKSLEPSEAANRELAFLREFHELISTLVETVDLRQQAINVGGRPQEIDERFLLIAYLRWENKKGSAPSAQWLKNRYETCLKKDISISSVTTFLKKIEDSINLPTLSEWDRKMINHIFPNRLQISPKN